MPRILWCLPLKLRTRGTWTSTVSRALPSFPTFLIAFSIYVPFIPYWRFIQYLHIWLTNRNLAARKKGKKIIPTFLCSSGFLCKCSTTTLLQKSTVFAIRIDWKGYLFCPEGNWKDHRSIFSYNYGEPSAVAEKWLKSNYGHKSSRVGQRKTTYCDCTIASYYYKEY